MVEIDSVQMVTFWPMNGQMMVDAGYGGDCFSKMPASLTHEADRYRD